MLKLLNLQLLTWRVSASAFRTLRDIVRIHARSSSPLRMDSRSGICMAYSSVALLPRQHGWRVMTLRPMFAALE